MSIIPDWLEYAVRGNTVPEVDRQPDAMTGVHAAMLGEQEMTTMDQRMINEMLGARIPTNRPGNMHATTTRQPIFGADFGGWTTNTSPQASGQDLTRGILFLLHKRLIINEEEYDALVATNSTQAMADLLIRVAEGELR